ncbi:MAG: DEAD/DEAH box helicase [Bacteroidia bacterium]|nr:DEAD/DEAH box helicase [Bacteroidia bacterium]
MAKDQRGFERYRLHDRSLDAIPHLGFDKPTAVQEKVIPLFLSKRNLIVEAPTGTGKTAAYGLPLINMIDLLKKSTQALILVPSRELAIQVSTALRSYFAGERLQVGAVYGGTSMEESFEAIKAAPHILVVVPGRLKDVMAHYKHDYLWRDIKFLIVDEGDKLLESGFQKDFDDIRGFVRSTVQVGFFSATIPRESEEMMRERYPKIQTIRLKPKDLLKNIKFFVAQVAKGKRETHLAGLIQQDKLKKALIFASRREDIFGLTRFLRNCGLKAESYYGNLSQEERAHILKRFKEGHIDFLVASDLAARGLDIEALPAVINLSIPQEFDYYLHRVGRTGRAGNPGKVFNLISGSIEEIRITQHHNRIELPLREKNIRPFDRADLVAEDGNRWEKYHLNRGKRDKIRPGDIVGFLSNKAGLESDEIGTINIYEAYAVVDMPERGYHELMKGEEPLKLKGKNVKISKYMLEAQEKKAKAIKKLKKDRR